MLEFDSNGNRGTGATNWEGTRLTVSAVGNAQCCVLAGGGEKVRTGSATSATADRGGGGEKDGGGGERDGAGGSIRGRQSADRLSVSAWVWFVGPPLINGSSGGSMGSNDRSSSSEEFARWLRGVVRLYACPSADLTGNVVTTMVRGDAADELKLRRRVPPPCTAMLGGRTSGRSPTVSVSSGSSLSGPSATVSGNSAGGASASAVTPPTGKVRECLFGGLRSDDTEGKGDTPVLVTRDGTTMGANDARRIGVPPSPGVAIELGKLMR
jgi:hypothetical protein